jgi:hypothetical protein
MFRSAVQHDERKAADLKFNAGNFGRQIVRIKDEIENIRSSEKNSVAQFGPFMVALCADIDREHNRGRFKQKPVGPIGKS